jgi:hypothetical protein
MQWELLVLLFISVVIYSIRQTLIEILRQTMMIRELLIRNDARSGQIRAELKATREAVSPKLEVFEAMGRENAIHDDAQIDPPETYLDAMLVRRFPRRRWWEF